MDLAEGKGSGYLRQIVSAQSTFPRGACANQTKYQPMDIGIADFRHRRISEHTSMSRNTNLQKTVTTSPECRDSMRSETNHSRQEADEVRDQRQVPHACSRDIYEVGGFRGLELGCFSSRQTVIFYPKRAANPIGLPLFAPLATRSGRQLRT